MTETGLISSNAPTIVVLHASVGSGHKVAAEAIAQALEQLREQCRERFPAFPGEMNVQVFDILDFGRIRFDGDKTATMFTGPTRPIYDITWRFVLTGRILWGGGTIWARLMFPAFTAWVREHKPTAVIATHITAANVALSARMITKQSFPLVCVPTDYDVEGLWPHRYTDLFCVATESMAETLRARKVEEERILITGIPARSEFSAGYDRDAVRRDWNIPADKPMAIVLAGASLSQPYVLFRDILDRALPAFAEFDNLYTVFLAGRDEEYAATLRARLAEENVANATVLTYTEDVAKLMAASDFCICKAGGLTVTECLCTHTPMVLVGRAYGQEKVNVTLLTSLGAAMHVQTARELAWTLRYISQSMARLESLREGEDYLRKPDAAAQIAIAAMQAIYGETDEATRSRRAEHHFIKFYWGHQPAHTR
jgi:processive 1,2-diacylglycerol beta-glucosyltransferase